MSSWAGTRGYFHQKKASNISLIKPISVQPSIPNVATITVTSIYKKQPINDVVICAIALNEELYIDEWIKYHLSLEFSHIYIYDNSETNTLKDKQTDRVTIIHYPGITKQLPAYIIFAKQHTKKHKWAAFIDIDEFIVLKVHNNINSFINEYENFSGIALSWLMFGSSNEKDYRNEPVTKRFQKCSSKVNIHYKCIAKLKDINVFYTPHRPDLYRGKICDVKKRIVNDLLYPDGTTEIACIHHYYTKSEEEFIKKLKRGRADVIEPKNMDEIINLHNNNNDVHNSDAWDFYSKHL